MSWLEIFLRISIPLFGLWALFNVILIAIEIWKKTRED